MVYFGHRKCARERARGLGKGSRARQGFKVHARGYSNGSRARLDGRQGFKS